MLVEYAEHGTSARETADGEDVIYAMPLVVHVHDVLLTLQLRQCPFRLLGRSDILLQMDDVLCQREQRPNLFGLCRVQPIFNEVNAANNSPKVTSSAKVHYFSEKQSYLNEKSYLNTIICHFLFKVGSINYHRKQINYGLCFFPY